MFAYANIRHFMFQATLKIDKMINLEEKIGNLKLKITFIIQLEIKFNKSIYNNIENCIGVYGHLFLY